MGWESCWESGWDGQRALGIVSSISECLEHPDESARFISLGIVPGKVPEIGCRDAQGSLGIVSSISECLEHPRKCARVFFLGIIPGKVPDIGFTGIHFVSFPSAWDIQINLRNYPRNYSKEEFLELGQGCSGNHFLPFPFR